LSIAFRTLPVGPFATNCYVLRDEATGHAAVIDPGGDLELITDLIESMDASVQLVLITHGHPDHCFCADPIAREFNAQIAMHPADVAALEENLPFAEMFYDMSEYVPFEPSRLLSDGDVIALGESEISAIHTPGHSPGGICLLTDEGLFCGDTIFEESVGRTDFPGGSWDDLINSIRTRILTLPDNTRLFPGHGRPTTVGAERASNPYIR